MLFATRRPLCRVSAVTRVRATASSHMFVQQNACRVSIVTRVRAKTSSHVSVLQHVDYVTNAFSHAYVTYVNIMLITVIRPISPATHKHAATSPKKESDASKLTTNNFKEGGSQRF